MCVCACVCKYKHLYVYVNEAGADRHTHCLALGVSLVSLWCFSGVSALHLCVKRDLLQCQKRIITLSKETYVSIHPSSGLSLVFLWCLCPVYEAGADC